MIVDRDIAQPDAIVVRRNAEHLELIAFRLVLFIAGVAFIALGTLGALHRRDAAQWQDLVGRLDSELREITSTCDAHPNLTTCEPDYATSIQQQLDHAVDSRYRRSRSGTLLLTLALAVPLSAMGAFYAGRWILSGRIRPLWPLRARGGLSSASEAR